MRSKSDISNSAIRIFLQKVGSYYDNARGLKEFKRNKKCKAELLRHFEGKCCYCDKEISIDSVSLDHLTPMNKEYLGLHAWGNIVPCCSGCNNQKNNRNWKEFLKSKSPQKVFQKKLEAVERFMLEMNYNPNINLFNVATNLYADVGEVATTLINLRYSQAKEEIVAVLSKKK